MQGVGGWGGVTSICLQLKWTKCMFETDKVEMEYE